MEPTCAVLREYLCVSQDRSGFGKSPEQQQDEMDECARQKGWKLNPRPYRDTGLTVTTMSPWVRSRGIGRLFAHETKVSDLILLLSDHDPRPWADVVGFVPTRVLRQAQFANHADLLLISAEQSAVIEVKLGHTMGSDQQPNYESLQSAADLYLAALSFDEVRLDVDDSRWRFLSLGGLVGRWVESDDEVVRTIATEAAEVLNTWDLTIASVFDSPGTHACAPPSTVTQTFLGRVVTRRIARDLRDRGRLAAAG